MLTHSEKRSRSYANKSQPTDPAKVRRNTSLESLNLNWSERELPERVRTKHVHRLHPYLGKYIPQLVEVFLRRYFKADQTVLDPVCGSGTTLVQANELGIHSIGLDISAFNVLLSRVKTTKYDVGLANREIRDILLKLQASIKDEPQQSLFAAEYRKEHYVGKVNRAYLEKWFAPKALAELLKYLSLIDSEGYEYRDLLKVILCRSARSARLTTHYDLDFPKRPQTEPYHCYKHSRVCAPTTDAMKFLERYSIDTAKRISEFDQVRSDAKVTVQHCDSRSAIIPRHHGVVTSPPYVGLIDYHEQHAYAYALLGMQDNRGSEIGPAANGSSQKARDAYKKSITEVFANALRTMHRGSRIIVVANDRSSLYGDIAKDLGVKVEAVVQRHVNRRTGRRSNEFFESIFVWR